ncbi:MAG: hypothetical protein AAF353_19060, partial [Pseudomonadota bacterium]
TAALLAAVFFYPVKPSDETVDLSGLYKGKYLDKGRNVRRNKFRLKIRHEGERLEAEALDNTLWITGLVVESKVFVEWEHASGNRGKGVWDILEGGSRLKGVWDSEGSGRFYGEWDFTRQ